MAEDQENEDELSDEEKTELESLLEDNDSENEAAGGLKGKLQKIFSNKKILLIVGLLLLSIIIVIGLFITRDDKDTQKTSLQENVTDPKIDENIEGKNEIDENIEGKNEEEVDEKVEISKVNIYKLEPFFLPISDDGSETNKFISVSASFLLSNSVLGREIVKVLPLMRKNIYKILKRKRLADFTNKSSKTEEKIKKEILASSNALLLSGSGTITDVFFSRFMIK